MSAKATVLALIAALQAACMGPTCHDEILSTVPSPDKKHVATVFERNCGATTDYSQIVALHSSDQKFSADSEDRYVLTVSGRSRPAISWADGNELRIVISAPANQIFRRLESLNDVRISVVPR